MNSYPCFKLGLKQYVIHCGIELCLHRKQGVHYKAFLYCCLFSEYEQGVNPLLHTTHLQQSTLKTSWQNMKNLIELKTL